MNGGGKELAYEQVRLCGPIGNDPLNAGGLGCTYCRGNVPTFQKAVIAVWDPGPRSVDCHREWLSAVIFCTGQLE